MDNGKIVHNLDTPQIEKSQSFMLSMNENSLPFPKAEYGWRIFPSNIADGNTLFYPIGTYALIPLSNVIQDLGDINDVKHTYTYRPLLFTASGFIFNLIFGTSFIICQQHNFHFKSALTNLTVFAII